MSRFLAFASNYPSDSSFTYMVAFSVHNFTMLLKVTPVHQGVANPGAPIRPLAKNNKGSLICEEN